MNDFMHSQIMQTHKLNRQTHAYSYCTRAQALFYSRPFEYFEPLYLPVSVDDVKAFNLILSGSKSETFF